VHLVSNFVGGKRLCSKNFQNAYEDLRLRHKKKSKLKPQNRAVLTHKHYMEDNQSNSINKYYLPTAGFLYGGKSDCKIAMKKER
jgi:hypothetical protein